MYYNKLSWRPQNVWNSGYLAHTDAPISVLVRMYWTTSGTFFPITRTETQHKGNKTKTLIMGWAMPHAGKKGHGQTIKPTASLTTLTRYDGDSVQRNISLDNKRLRRQVCQTHLSSSAAADPKNRVSQHIIDHQSSETLANNFTAIHFQPPYIGYEETSWSLGEDPRSSRHLTTR